MSLLNADYSYAVKNTENRTAPYAQSVYRYSEELASERMDFTGWVDYPCRVSDETLAAVESAARDIKEKCGALVVLGIGGSYLGAKAGYDMLFSERDESFPELYFAGWNLSASYHAQLVKKLMDKDICVVVVSKSGNTMETSAAFKLFKQLLLQKYQSDFAKRIYAVTDEKSGSLRKEADEYGYKTFVLDGDIGGRYSVLTAAGLLPLCAAGIDIRRIIEGARRAQRETGSPYLSENDCYKYAVIRRLLNEDGKKLEIFASYEPCMEYFNEWLKQLFGESEGKEGKGVYPASVVFSRDLHSLGQFLQEGTPVFFESVLFVKNPPCDIQIKGEAGYSQMNEAVYEAVSKAHAAGGAPVIRFELDSLSCETFGYMVYFFEKACAMSCLLLGVNPFDQPGVEVYKTNVRQLLS